MTDPDPGPTYDLQVWQQFCLGQSTGSIPYLLSFLFRKSVVETPLFASIKVSVPITTRATATATTKPFTLSEVTYMNQSV